MHANMYRGRGKTVAIVGLLINVILQYYAVHYTRFTSAWLRPERTSAPIAVQHERHHVPRAQDEPNVGQTKPQDEGCLIPTCSFAFLLTKAVTPKSIAQISSHDITRTFSTFPAAPQKNLLREFQPAYEKITQGTMYPEGTSSELERLERRSDKTHQATKRSKQSATATVLLGDPGVDFKFSLPAPGAMWGRVVIPVPLGSGSLARYR